MSSIERELYLRLIINDNGNCAGYYKLNLCHLASDMGKTEEEVIALLNQTNKFWAFDEETEQVLLPKYTKYNIVRGNPQITKLNAELSQLSPCKLHKVFLKAWEDCNGLGAERLIDPKFRMIAEDY